MSAHTPLTSQLILRSGGTQLVVACSLSAGQLADLAERVIAQSPRQASVWRMWGTLCAELVRTVGDSGQLALSIPTHPGLPTVWVSEVESRQFVVTTDTNSERSWIMIESGRSRPSVSAVGG